MGDLQDLIARSSVIAFNTGYKQGRLDERSVIMRMAKEAQCHVQTDDFGEYVYLQDLIDYLEEEDAKKSSQSKN